VIKTDYRKSGAPFKSNMFKNMMKLMTHKNPIETYDDKYDGTRHET